MKKLGITCLVLTGIATIFLFIGGFTSNIFSTIISGAIGAYIYFWLDKFKAEVTEIQKLTLDLQPLLYDSKLKSYDVSADAVSKKMDIANKVAIVSILFSIIFVIVGFVRFFTLKSEIGSFYFQFYSEELYSLLSSSLIASVGLVVTAVQCFWFAKIRKTTSEITACVNSFAP